MAKATQPAASAVALGQPDLVVITEPTQAEIVAVQQAQIAQLTAEMQAVQ